MPSVLDMVKASQTTQNLQPPVTVLADPVKDDPNVPKAIPNWYNSRSAEAIIKSTILTVLQWIMVSTQTGKWDDWQTSLIYPIISGVFVIISEMWSGTVKGPFSFQNTHNLDVPVKGKTP